MIENESLQKLSMILKDGNLHIADNFIGNLIIIILIQYAWTFMDDFSFLLINTMISMSVPGIVKLL